MTPVERLQAAIEKLETLKTESTPGPWSVNVHHNAMHSAEFRAPNPFNGFMLVAAHTNDVDPELIVTLHRTIDAQIAVLDNTLVRYAKLDPSGEWEPRAPGGVIAMSLADAILGTPQILVACVTP